MFEKMNIKRILCLILAILMVLGTAYSLFITALAATYYGSASALFSDEMYEWEHERQEAREIASSQSESDEESKTEPKLPDYEIIRRADTSVTVRSDEIIGDLMHIIIPKGKTLTVDKGVTLKVYGKLTINGKLVNNGTIIVGDKYDEDYKNNKTFLLNSGNITNNGTIRLAKGALENNPGAELKNEGEIRIVTGTSNGAAIINIEDTVKDKSVFGSIINNGTIYVENASSFGIHNYSRALLENNGDIYMNGKSSIRGIITGNQPVWKK